MKFDFPEALILLLLLLPLAWASRRGDSRTREVASLFRGRPPKRWFSVLRTVFGLLFIGALVLASARPYVEASKTADYLFVSDVSRSMQARRTCGEPTFLERSKRVMREALTAVPEARFGILAFDRVAFPITQMTHDHDYLEEVIEEALNPGLFFEATATELGAALSAVAQKKERLPEIFGNVENVILLSDGHVGGGFRRRLAEPIRELQEAGVRVLSVGVGNPEPTPISRTASDGKCIGKHIEVDGQTVAIPLRDDILKFVASETGGRYFAEGETEELAAWLRESMFEEVEDSPGLAGRRQDVSWFFLIPSTIGLIGLLVLRGYPGKW